MFGFYLRHIRLIRLSGFFLPFIIKTKVICSIRKGAKVHLESRIHFGNKKLLTLSGIQANLQIGTKANVHFGKSVSIGPGVNIIVKPNASFSVGDSTYFTSDSHVEASNEISIGSGCAISWGISIIDSNHHEIIYENQQPQKSYVKIGNHVWIGCNTILLPGTEIGNGSVVAAGSLVKGQFPENCLIGGNPARIIRQNIQWK